MELKSGKDFGLIVQKAAMCGLAGLSFDKFVYTKQTLGLLSVSTHNLIIGASLGIGVLVGELFSSPLTYINDSNVSNHKTLAETVVDVAFATGAYYALSLAFESPTKKAIDVSFALFYPMLSGAAINNSLNTVENFKFNK